MTKKKQVGVRFDSNRTRLKTGETQRPNGTYAYRWSTPDGKRHSIYAPTLEKLREQEEQIIVDKHDGIRSDVKSITVNEMFDLWCQLKRGIKDSTFKNYIYMYELFVKPSFGKNRLVQVKKSDVRKFYNSLADGKVLLFTETTQVQDLMAVLGKMGLSSNVVYMVVASFRSINELSDKMGQILEAQSSRGIETEGNLFVRLKAILPMLITLLLSSMVSAEEKAIALEARCFNCHCKRTSLRVNNTSRADVVTMIGIAFVTAALIAVKFIFIK